MRLRDLISADARHRAALFITLMALLFPMTASAQTAVTTLGADDARNCYHDALNATVTDSDSCDTALRSSNLTKKDERATFVNRGIILNRAGKYDEAIKDFDRALAGKGDLAEALLNRGNSYFLKGQLDQALDDYEASIEAGLQKVHFAWYNIGLVRGARKDWQGAIVAFEKALEANPGYTPAQEKLVDTREKQD